MYRNRLLNVEMKLINITQRLSGFEKFKTTGQRFFSGLNLWNEELSTSIKHQIESHWKNKIKHETHNFEHESAKKFYVLSMFPYPSGSLHMGHVRVYTISDAIARFQRMNGKHVIHPIGWDAFGLPAENAAIERNIAPDEWTENNISHMKTQLKRLACSFDWDREISTCDPSYYEWTQNLFIKLFDAGLVYQKRAMVNWDPIDQTVLADEQVDENGFSWRSGAKVEKKPLKQWFIKTTRFAKDLQEGLNDSNLKDWRDVIKLQQHWIGECNGVNFDFKIMGSDDFITLWTQNPEYLSFAKFVAVTPEHLLNENLNFKGTRKLSVELIHPLTNQKLPVFVTDELEFSESDSFLGVPLNCEQSEKFAKKFNIPFEKMTLSEDEREFLRNRICRQAQELNVGGYWTSAKLRDWLISRQRFWGTPIPIVHCQKCGPQPIRELVQLPKVKQLSKKDASLLKESDWMNCTCPQCQGEAKRETDTMDTFVDSSWYYLRYLDPKNSQQVFDVDKISGAMPVDLYIGGKEHAVLHLYYARFIAHFLHSLGLLPHREPFQRLLVQGMVMGRSFRVKGSGRYVQEKEVEVLGKKKNKAVLRETGESVTMAWEKMSKSKHNGVHPDDMFSEYSVDTTRLLILADVAPTSHRNWNSNTFPGIINWQKRLWLTVGDFIKYRTEPPPSITEEQFRIQDEYMFDSRNYYVKCTTFNYCGSQQHSVALSKMQGLTNSIRRAPPTVFAKSLQFERALAAQIILLAPMAPHFASELWSGFISAPNRLNTLEEIDWDKGVLAQNWPKIDPDYQMNLVCKVNGSEVCTVKIPKWDFDRLTEVDASEIALNQESVKIELVDKTILYTRYITQPDYEGVFNITTSVSEKIDSAEL